MLFTVRSASQAINSADKLEGISVRIAILTGLSQANFHYLTGGIDG